MTVAGRTSSWPVLLVLLSVLVAASSLPVGAWQPPRPADEEFRPIDELPPDEKLPAAPFVIAAYSVAWIVVAGYLWTIWQRLGRVEREVADVTRRVQQKSHPSGGSPPGGGTLDAPRPGSGGGG
jgi:CcmD family protein